VSGTPEQISDDEVCIPRLHGTFPPQPSAHAAAPLPADIDDEVHILPLSHHDALVSCYGDAAVSQAPVFLALSPSPPLLLFALKLFCRLAAVADALLGPKGYFRLASSSSSHPKPEQNEVANVELELQQLCLLGRRPEHDLKVSRGTGHPDKERGPGHH
jgi:hypothetical protein